MARTLYLLVGVLVVGCSDGTGPPPPPPLPGVTVIATPLGQDTIEARPNEALVLLVRDSTGGPAEGMGVELAAIFDTAFPPDCCGVEPTMLLRLPGQFTLSTTVGTTVDADGEVAVEVTFGRKAGPGGIIVRVSNLGVVDTVPFTILPGKAVQFKLPPDTSVMLGATLTWPDAKVWDRWRNERDDPVAFAVDGVLGLSSGGALAIETGPGRVFAVSGDFLDTMHVTVVPEGMLAAYQNLTGIVVANMDGSDRRVLVPGAHVSTQYGGMAWTPDGDRLLFRDQSNFMTRMDQISLSGARSTLPIPHSLFPSWPDVSPDGEWVYFSGVDRIESQKLWRIRLDGTGLEQISGTDTTLEWRGDVSRTGDKIVFVTSLSFFAVRDLGAGTITPLPLGGQIPRFSPVVDKIAFLTASPTGNIAIMDPDGSNVVTLTTTGDYGEGLDWSSDGKWIVGQRAGRLEVIEVATGKQIPLWWAVGLAKPVWRPE